MTTAHMFPVHIPASGGPIGHSVLLCVCVCVCVLQATGVLTAAAASYPASAQAAIVSHLKAVEAAEAARTKAIAVLRALLAELEGANERSAARQAAAARWQEAVQALSKPPSASSLPVVTAPQPVAANGTVAALPPAPAPFLPPPPLPNGASAAPAAPAAPVDDLTALAAKLASNPQAFVEALKALPSAVTVAQQGAAPPAVVTQGAGAPPMQQTQHAQQTEDPGDLYDPEDPFGELG